MFVFFMSNLLRQLNAQENKISAARFCFFLNLILNMRERERKRPFVIKNYCSSSSGNYNILF